MYREIKKEEDRKFTVIHEIVSAVNNIKSVETTIQSLCQLIPQAFIRPEQLSVAIIIGDKTYFSKNFIETRWIERRSFDVPGMCLCAIEFYYQSDFLQKDDQVFSEQNSEFIESISSILNGALSKYQLEKLYHENSERLKELQGINRATDALNRGRTLEESLQEICAFLPEAWQYPEYTVARITYEDKVFKSKNFKETQWVQNQYFETPGGKKGTLEIYYLKDLPPSFEGPFLREERNLIDNLASQQVFYSQYLHAGIPFTPSFRDIVS